MMKGLVFLFLIGILGFKMSANNNDFELLKSKYSKYNAVITQRSFDYLFDVKGGVLLAQQTNTKKTLLLNERSKAYTNDNIFYSSFSTIAKKEAYTLVPKSNGYAKIAVENYTESHDQDGSAFFDDSKTINFAYPSLQQGAITFSNYTINYLNPRFIRNAFLQSYIPIIDSKITIKAHHDVTIGYKVFNDVNDQVIFNKYSKGKYNYFEWSVKDIEPYEYMGGSTYSIRHFSPHVAIYIKETNINGQKEKYFGSIDDLYKFYNQFVEQIPKTKLPELKNLVNEITNGLSDSAAAKAIYYWVQNNIKYVAYEQGLKGFIPMSADEVFVKRFGDCKGMANLIKEMMNLAGQSCYHAWVGTRHIPYTYEQMPLPAVDNHMVASFYDGDKVVVMDGTFNYIDYGVYPFHLQEKEILMGISPDEYKIFKVPISPASANTIVDSVNIVLKGDSILGQAKRMHTGFNKMELAYALDGVKPSNYPKSLTRMFNKGSNKFNVKECEVKHLFEHEKAAEIDYSFVLHDYVKSMGDEIYLNLNLDKSLQDMHIDTVGYIAPVENDFYFIERHITRFIIPDDYIVTYLPKGGAYQYDGFSVLVKYDKIDGAIVMETKIVFEFLVLLKDQFEDWNKMIKLINNQYRSTLVLKRI